ncbi:GH36-type glycosyl hydrolase domain-containing protein [Alkalihalobacillus sp. AL-G]|uniref:GH36-type glycosyl hydrolase domain-containing protein n=1 Tax=Alkalihalobacillus sp. AL-G TaxID=2926399 RepID=UPI00272B0C29|nr:amylo-alpha-1,6-glucosidase [Alkalihalobacillus sp. AL-G]WLD92808.1 cellobiose phosphorylase [Alkalihalobacillus sp. AL-G]
MTITTKTDSRFQLNAGDFHFTFLNSGDLYEATHKSTMINQLISNPLDGSLNNLYLRLFETDGGIKVTPMFGVQSNSKMSVSDSKIKWEGSFETVQYQVTFHLTEKGIWFWHVEVEGSDAEIDLIYGQDLGLADKGAVRSNEAYMSQYMDHSVYENAENGYVICSRQNQPQQTGFPYIQQGALSKVAGYSTDGFQFFGLSYKKTDKPEALNKPVLANEVYQYEFAYVALQSERIQLTDKCRFTFYGLYKEDHPDAVTSLEFEKELAEAWEQVNASEEPNWRQVEKVSLSPEIGAPLQTLPMTEDEIDRNYPGRNHVERKDDTLLSFFTDSHEHVILKEKELLVERSHGHILMSGQNDRLNENVMTTTSYMVGVFNAQLVIGNTSFNKMLSNTRNALNIMKTSGQRIHVEIDGVYRLLTMPSLFELGFNYAKWIYKIDNDVLTITNYTTVDSPDVTLSVKSESGTAYRYLITNQVTMNTNEFEAPFKVERNDRDVSFYADPSSDSADTFPNLSYRLHIDGAGFEVEDEQALASNIEPGSASLIVLNLSSSSEFTMTVQGVLHGEERPLVQKDMNEEVERYREFYRGVMNGFQLTANDSSVNAVEKLNTLAWWYTHNMLIHFSVPHGLEQYGGAAWGTRDVCQGPTEYFLATQNYGTVQEIIKTVYSHQYEDEGNWPQWFMFDKYFKIQQDDSHGDVIVWPLKVVSDYITATGDFDILQEKVPYTLRDGFDFSEEKATILDHLKKQLSYIKSHFLHDTFLSSYGDGDWDDTLQPANQQLKQYMVSSWTVALTYQVVEQLARALEKAAPSEASELRALADGIKEDFNRYMLQTDVLPGFLYMEDPNDAKLMLHPTDTETGINYRLIPMNRSIISELFTPEQAKAHFETIKEHLYCPDGVRLMNRPAHYNGGVSTNFKRAEQASNFGREIGLQYVHAHIRFVEAMAKLGYSEEVWKGLETINPIGIKDVVPNAEYRQSNTYFSSSDGKFNNRYEAQERFDELREGNVPVKGGWRIYSSGPGIYMNQLISNALGIRQEGGNLVVDPVLPAKLDGLRFEYRFMDRPVTIVYHLDQNENRIVVNGCSVEASSVSNRYREGGFVVDRTELGSLLKNEDNMIEIQLKN